jgi:type IV secretion system protein TrbB
MTKVCKHRIRGMAMSSDSSRKSSALDRSTQMLRTAMGATIAQALADPEVVEILLNPDGSLWVDRLQHGREPTGTRMEPDDAERIIRLVAAHVRAEVHSGAPILSAELPETGERFEGILPPVVRAPAFSIRKRAVGIISLEQYVAAGTMNARHAEFLHRAVRERLNILIAGGTSTGKTTLANALLAAMADTGDRVILLEDTVELQCTAADHVPLRTRPGVVSMTELVRSTLRLRPDRIVIGEVRGPEALDLLKAWGTGHPGGIATLHANSAAGALSRLEQLIQEIATHVPRALIAETIDVIVFIAGRGRSRRVRDIVGIQGFDHQGYQLHSLITEGDLP